MQNISVTSHLVVTKTGKQWYFHTAEFAQQRKVYSLESAMGFASRSSIICLASVCQALLNTNMAIWLHTVQNAWTHYAAKADAISESTTGSVQYLQKVEHVLLCEIWAFCRDYHQQGSLSPLGMRNGYHCSLQHLIIHSFYLCFLCILIAPAFFVSLFLVLFPWTSLEAELEAERKQLKSQCNV